MADTQEIIEIQYIVNAAGAISESEKLMQTIAQVRKQVFELAE